MAAYTTFAQLLDACVLYHRETARSILETPVGEERETRLANVEAQGLLGSPEAALETLRALLLEAPEGEQADHQALYAWWLETYIRCQFLPLQRESLATQRQGTCVVDGEPIALLGSFAAMASERRRERRAAIEAAVVDALEPVNTVLARQFDTLKRLAEPLGYMTLEAMWDEGTAATAHHDMAQQVLQATAEEYADLLDWGVKRRLRIPPGQLKRHDVLALFTFAEYQRYYQPNTVVAQLATCLRMINLDPTAAGQLRWHERLPHFGPPVALALDIPHEIVLSYHAVQGLQSTEAFANACGRALLWAHTAAEAPLLRRWRGDAAILTSSAQWLGTTLTHPRWLRQYFSINAERNYGIWRRLDRLYRVRRALGRFLYTRHLYTATSLAGAKEAYRELMMDACHVEYPAAYYLLDIDWFYDTLAEMRGWGLTYGMVKALQQACSVEWFRVPESGDWLRHYWAQALQGSVETLLPGLTGATWGAEWLVEALLDEDTM